MENGKVWMPVLSYVALLGFHRLASFDVETAEPLLDTDHPSRPMLLASLSSPELRSLVLVKHQPWRQDSGKPGSQTQDSPG